MKTLFRLALTLAVAAVTCLTPVAFAEYNLDQGRDWTDNYGTTRFYWSHPNTHPLYGRYVVYSGLHIHKDDNLRCEITAAYWVDYDEVTFTYKNAKDQGNGSLLLAYTRDHVYLSGRWNSTVSAQSGQWSLWRLRNYLQPRSE